MAKPSWLTVTPGSGSGNGVLQNTGSVHTGRLVRTGIVTVTGVGVAQPKTYNVTQEAKPEFITIDNGADMAADKLGGKVTVTGKSNSAALTFAWVGDDLEATIAAQYTAGGKSTTNGETLVFTRATAVSVSSDSLTIEDSDITVTNETLII